MSPNDAFDEFFDRERASIEQQPTSSEHWDSIVHEHRRAGRAPRWRYVAGAAAAVVAVGALGLALRPGTDEDALPADSSTSTSSTTSLPSTPTPSVVTVTETVEGTPTTITIPATGATSSTASGPVLAVFDVVSVTNSGNGHRAALGRASCSGAPCTAVITSVDDGAHWTVVSSQPGEVAGASGNRILRFANDNVGWLVGTDVRRTTDGGRSWTPYAHPGKHVFSLETDGRDVVLAAGDSATADGSRQLTVSRAAVSDTSASAVGRPLASSAFSDASVSWNAHTAYVMPESQAGGDGALRVDPSALTSLPIPRDRTPVEFASSAGDGTLFSLGAQGGAAGQLGFEVLASTDGGATWKVRTTGPQPLLLANAGQVALAATDARHLVAVSGGTPDLHGSMKVSSDGGGTWHAPAAAPPLPDRGWSWVGSPGGGVVYAVATDPDGAYWWSGDHGEHWQQAALDR